MGSARAVRLGEVLEPAGLPGLVAEHDGERIGLLTYIVDGAQFEVLSLHCRVENAGAGSALLEAGAALAAGRGCRRLWLVTTNDNLHALGFYQRRGLRLCTLHAGSLDRDRALKPELPEVNPDNRIPLRIYDMMQPGALMRILRGEPLGTLVHERQDGANAGAGSRP